MEENEESKEVAEKEEEEELLHPFVNMEAEEDSRQSEGSTGSVASYDTELFNGISNVHVAERGTFVCALLAANGISGNGGFSKVWMFTWAYAIARTTAVIKSGVA